MHAAALATAGAAPVTVLSPAPGGGTSSGLMSFLEVFDRAAGATKSGMRRARAASTASPTSLHMRSVMKPGFHPFDAGLSGST